MCSLFVYVVSHNDLMVLYLSVMSLKKRLDRAVFLGIF